MPDATEKQQPAADPGANRSPDVPLKAWQPVAKARTLAAAAAAGQPIPSATYRGGCHCGAIAYDVTLAPPLEVGHTVINCSCSACRRFGYLLVYPTRENVVFRNRGGGQARCSVYQFNTRVQEHLFCKLCGSSLMIDFRNRFKPNFDGYGINVRSLYDVNIDELNIEKNDGEKTVKPAGDLSGQWYVESDPEEEADK